jgi:hypothetical protein
MNPLMDDFAEANFAQKLLNSEKAEALGWLDGSSPTSFRNLGEMQTNEESAAFVKRIYSMGAKSVLAVEIVKWEQGENTGKLLIELPNDRFARSELFAFEKQHAESMGFDGSPDKGQQYLFLNLD